MMICCEGGESEDKMVGKKKQKQKTEREKELCMIVTTQKWGLEL